MSNQPFHERGQALDLLGTKQKAYDKQNSYSYDKQSSQNYDKFQGLQIRTRTKSSIREQELAGVSPTSIPRSSTDRQGGATPRISSSAFLIGVAGGTASGKSTVCELIMQRMHDQCVAILTTDSFYRTLTEEMLAEIPYGFDNPKAFDVDLIVEALNNLRHGKEAEIPIYDFQTHSRVQGDHQLIQPADVIIIEGILVLHMPQIRDMCNMKVFVDTDDDVRLARRIIRDVAERGRDVSGVIKQYTQQVKPAFDQFVIPSRKYADIIIPWQAHTYNVVPIDLVTEHIKIKLSTHDLRKIYHQLTVVPSNYQIRGMHTIVRDKSTSKNDFCFYADRLNRIVVEAALGLLPFKRKVVETPIGSKYYGVEFSRGICGVSIIRSGESMENALRACCQGIKIGKILVLRSTRSQDIQQSQELKSKQEQYTNDRRKSLGQDLNPVEDGLKDVIYEKLPNDIADRHVMVMDPVLANGLPAVQAIKILLKRGVQVQNIIFLTLIASPEGIKRVLEQYPQITLVTSEIDNQLDENDLVVPGIGQFGDRYFCD